MVETDSKTLADIPDEVSDEGSIRMRGQGKLPGLLVQRGLHLGEQGTWPWIGVAVEIQGDKVCRMCVEPSPVCIGEDVA